MKKNYLFIILFIISLSKLYSQDCINFHLNNCPRIQEHNFYTVVPEGSKSILMKEGESFEVSFTIHQGKDYRITLCSELYDGRVVMKLYDANESNLLLFDNQMNEMIQSFEFQVIDTRDVRAIVTIQQDSNKKQMNTLLVEKVARGCVGLMLESMITRK